MKVPKEVQSIAEKLLGHGFKAYLVGGCLRDLLLKEAPNDWDIATDARPEKIQEIFPESVYENQFGTVGVKTENEDQSLRIIQVTTFRVEGSYSDARHPSDVRFIGRIEEDLSRRDFTVNAMAFDLGEDAEIIDPFFGARDLGEKMIRAVGNPEERFKEDALRLMRAVRLATQLGFFIEKETMSAIRTHASLLSKIAEERIRDEFTKLIMTSRAHQGINLMQELGLLKYILPELCEGVGVSQNKHHIYTVFEHNVRALEYTVSKNYSLHVRMASLLHDVGKPKTKRGEGNDSTFYGHEIVGARQAFKALDRLRFPRGFVDQVSHLVRYHLFYYNVDEVTPAGVRRFLARVGPENVDDLIKVREADRIGSGVPKAVPYKLRHLLFMIEKVKRDPVSPKMLAVRGEDVMSALRIEPSPRVGYILSILLEEVIENPSYNTKETLMRRIEELGKEKEEELKVRALKAKETKEEFEGGMEEEIKKKYWVK
ncbi:MAG: hypothetical protein A2586_00705 [Candidatus Harrisonbacteria bacterium RIFOXYD1_FULL_40_9]|uniref:HD domain-containing protein n=1 Tax=Candidatus Harrisonbacteria bacterium RIFOXYD1_FULL_40_9 TaxID=1798412 RepID=A0A1G1ZZC0_9BACT|nr:MAG: hypothetical protein A2586_00705 [Candidatus Harrisonbacteria bacterium RIFOXYD1_FULL_40_9]